MERLKTLYLGGIKNQEDEKEIKDLFRHQILSEYKISFNMKTINNDSIRRYFETHLAYESLKNGLSKIDKAELETHTNLLLRMFPVGKTNLRSSKINSILRGEFKHDDIAQYKEYADSIKKIREKRIFSELSDEDRSKIQMIVICSFLGVINAEARPDLPIVIYGFGIFSEENRGKRIIEDQKTTRNQHLGIMKGHMALQRNDIAFSSEIFPYLKPSDQSDYIQNAEWVKYNFNQLMHPFSNSISGTMLGQLRVLAFLGKSSPFMHETNKFSLFVQLFISTMLFNSGGHTLLEFFHPITLPPVRKAFRLIPNFPNIDLTSMYFTNNKESFDKALEDTIEYNKAQLMRKKLHIQIKNPINVEPTNKVLKTLEMSKHINQLVKKLEILKENYAFENKEQYFNFIRSGSKKIKIIQTEFEKIIKSVQNHDLISAKDLLLKLNIKLMEQFGELTFIGKKSQSIKLVEQAIFEVNNCLETEIRLFSDNFFHKNRINEDSEKEEEKDSSSSEQLSKKTDLSLEIYKEALEIHQLIKLKSSTDSKSNQQYHELLLIQIAKKSRNLFYSENNITSSTSISNKFKREAYDTYNAIPSEIKLKTAKLITSEEFKNAVINTFNKYIEINNMKNLKREGGFFENFKTHGIVGKENAEIFMKNILNKYKCGRSPQEIYQFICDHLENGPGKFGKTSFKTLLIDELSKISWLPPALLTRIRVKPL